MVDKTVYRLVAIWDLILTLPFALPEVNEQLILLLININSFISPTREFSHFSDTHLFFVQLFGMLAVLWAAVRIHRPAAFLAAYDTMGRFFVGIMMILFAINGGSLLPLIFSLSEIGFGTIQLVYLLKNKNIKEPKQ